MANRLARVAGTEVVLETNGAALTDGTLLELTDANITAANVDGCETMSLEMDVTGFSAVPTTGNALFIYEQKINSDIADCVDVEADYLRDLLHVFEFNDANAAQKLRAERIPVNFHGCKIWIAWYDGGSGTASISAGWVVRAIMEDIQTETV